MDEDLLAFYAKGEEDQRLVDGGPSRIEYARTFGVEGPGGLLWSRWDSPDDQANILHVARLLETEPSVIGTSAHLLVAGRKGPRSG